MKDSLLVRVVERIQEIEERSQKEGRVLALRGPRLERPPFGL